MGDTVDADSVPPEDSSDDGHRWSLPPGQIVAKRYRIVRELGRGGMGAVFEAFDINLERPVAIKFLDPDLTKKPDAIKRFQLEALAAGRIGHENICDVRDRGETVEGVPFIVMEMLDGEELKDLERRENQLAPDHAVEIVIQILDALEAAHDKGIVHRDLKPENIFLTKDSSGGLRVKILDFGVSRFTGETASIRLTRTGNVLGTPCYMSPEQAKGRTDVDQRSDIWAVGVILYEALTGRLPFSGENYNEVIANILIEEAMEPSMLVSPFSESLEAVIMGALEKELDDRYSSASEFAEDLRLAMENPGLDEWRAAVMAGSFQISIEDMSVDRDSAPPQPSSTEGGNGDAPRATATTEEFQEWSEEAPETPTSSPSMAAVTPPRFARGRVALITIVGVLGVVMAIGATLLFLQPTNSGNGEPRTETTSSSELRPPPSAPEKNPTESPGIESTEETAAPVKVAPAPADDLPTLMPSTVELTVRVEPESARLVVDGVELEGNPWVGRFPRDEIQHRVEASAPGYETLARFVAFDQDREIELVLDRERAVVHPRKQPSDQPRERPGGQPSTPGKARFDRDNPYGER